VLEDGVVVGRVFLMPIGLKGRPWMWVIRNRKGRTPGHGYEPTREAAMAAFKKAVEMKPWLGSCQCIQVLELHPARPEAASRSNTSSSPSGSMYFGS
jgi:hypothetical protein